MPCFGPRGGGRGSLQEDQDQRPPRRRGGGERAKPSRLRLAKPAHARALAVRASHFIIFILIFLQHAAASDAAHDRSDPEDDSNNEKGRDGAGEKEADEPDHQADHGDDVMPLAR